jgi:hypothetical protein
VLVPRSSGYVALANLGSESDTCVGSHVHLVGVSISFEKNFFRLPFTPPLSGSSYLSFKGGMLAQLEKTLNVPLVWFVLSVSLIGANVNSGQLTYHSEDPRGILTTVVSRH